MTIKSNNKKYLISPEGILEFLGIKTEKYVLIDKDTNKFEISNENEYISGESWVEDQFDGRKFRKLKKNIFKEFGDELLRDYKTTDKIYKVLSSKFINTSGVSEVFKNSLANDMNLILFGKGGFGKSEMCNELFGCAELKDRVFIQSLSEATTEEDLFGGIKMKKFLDTGEKEFLIENSFANKEIVIFEEIFDANPRVLAALKDTLTAKELRNGNQRFPIKTKIIIGLTNKTYDEVIEDDSTEALTQRFPVSYKLQYDMTKMDTAGLILNRYPNFNDKKMAAILESINEMNDITPRKILEVAKYLKDLNIAPNKNYMERITNNSITPVINYLKAKKSIDIAKVIFDDIVSTKRNIREEKVTDYDSFVDIISNSKKIANYVASLEETAMQKSVIGEIIELHDLIAKKN